MRKILFVFCFFVAITSIQAQKPTDVLLTIDGAPVYVNEFERVYNKNLELVKDETQKTVDGYMTLFVDYKLKVAEAYAQDLNEDKDYKKEFEKYRDQLARNYVNETRLFEGIAEEAYARGKEQINANHILIKVGYDALPQDTLKAYNKVKSIREKALSGEDFVALAKANSEEPGASERGGDLGYFTAFSMVYPFESMAYNTPVGEISEIVRTSFGYHVMKINDRREREQPIEVSHIMISEKKNDPSFNSEERINELYKMLKQGSDFADLAKQFSDDKNSGKSGGKLKPFSKGQLRSEAFENTAYKLKEVGEISNPIKTRFGWHVLKLEQQMTESSFEEQKEDLYRKIKKGDRSKVISTQVTQDIIARYGIERTDYLDFFEGYVGDDVTKARWKITDTLKGEINKVIFKIGDKKIFYNEFADYIYHRQRFANKMPTKKDYISSMYKEFEDMELKEYLNEQLEIENPEFGAIISEYRDGLLIFDVMKKNVWQKAKRDTVGLKNYYDQVAANYSWDERINAEILSGGDQAKIKEAKVMLSSGKSAEAIKEALNIEGKVNVIISSGLYEKGDTTLPANLTFKKGISDVLSSGNTFSVVNVKEVLSPTVKEFDEIKGRVMSQYQNEVETLWMDSLRAKYEVSIKNKTLKKLKKRIE